ncbi:MAG: hypothetical protein ACYCWE_20970 [Eubacteriales bacterium]
MNGTKGNAKKRTVKERITSENRRLRTVYKGLSPDCMKIYDGLILRAAFMRVVLEDYEEDLNKNGSVEMFSQSEKAEPYERERPVARLYNTMNKNYQSIMKQLADKLPEAVTSSPADEVLDFIGAGKK